MISVIDIWISVLIVYFTTQITEKYSVVLGYCGLKCDILVNLSVICANTNFVGISSCVPVFVALFPNAGNL